MVFHSVSCMHQVLRKLRRLPWQEHEPYLVKTMLGATKGRYDDLPCVAALCGGLSQYHPSLGVALADALLEQVCSLAAELPQPSRGASDVRSALLHVACPGLMRHPSGSPRIQCYEPHRQVLPAESCDGAAAVQVRVGLETAEAGAYQRQVGYMRLLGELYAYRIVDSRYKGPDLDACKMVRD